MTKALPAPFRPIEEFFDEFPLDRSQVLFKIKRIRSEQRETAFRYCVDDVTLKSIVVFSGSSDEELCFAKVEPGGCFIYDPSFEAMWQDVRNKNLVRVADSVRRYNSRIRMITLAKSNNDVMTDATVGTFIDSVAGTKRTPKAVAGRLLEEVVELCLAANVKPEEIFMHVTDALHNQTLKASHAANATVFPSGLMEHTKTYRSDQSELVDEIADVSLVLRDLRYVMQGFRHDVAEQEKWKLFTQKSFKVTPSGVVYARKPHIK